MVTRIAGTGVSTRDSRKSLVKLTGISTPPIENFINTPLLDAHIVISSVILRENIVPSTETCGVGVEAIMTGTGTAPGTGAKSDFMSVAH
jgi:hypothetical protein